ncbi:hypothetical protein MBLNU230_g5994t1 [Neophaeotheca triangularis]
MSDGHGQQDAESPERRYKKPYNARRKIPTIAGYREEKEARQQKAGLNDDNTGAESRGQRAWDAYYRRKDDVQEEEDDEDDDDQYDDYEGRAPASEEQSTGGDEKAADGQHQNQNQVGPTDTSETGGQSADPKQRRKQMKRRNKKQNQQRAERQVTDPITHLPVTIHDFTNKALEDVEENDAAYGETDETATGIKNRDKSDEQLKKETEEMRKGSKGFDQLFPPPAYDVVRDELQRITNKGIWFGLGGSLAIMVGVLAMWRVMGLDGFLGARASPETGRPWGRMSVWLGMSGLAAGGIWAIVAGVRDWTSNRIKDVWDEEVWYADSQRAAKEADMHKAESTVWLNSLVSAVWPLINPDLFTGLADMLEDVMQASLPKVVRMVSVDDIGQGSENLRILGVRWLPTGAASRSVDAEGNLGKEYADQNGNEKGKGTGTSRDMDGDGQDDDTGENVNQPGGEDSGQGQEEGMEAEEGDFVNCEIAFAYKARSTAKTFRDRTKDMHMMLAFYLPSNVKVPVWVDLRGIVGTLRVRLQLAPDPPFFALATVTLLGQPKVDLSCIPLSRKAFNIMDIPLISNFVQASVDAALAEYVAPKSLALDLKGMLAGDDFKKDTSARGIVVITIKCGYDFKVGDQGIPLVKEGGSDPYVSVAWAKFGKPLWSTRLIMDEMNPSWQETAYLLVTPQELDVDERIRVQLWDSDRWTADNDLGRIELDLKSVMKAEESNGKMQDRCDGFRALKAGDDMPGQLEWSVGYFSKARIQKCQLEQQNYDPEVRSMQQLHDKVESTTHQKLREAKVKGDKFVRDESELEQQKAQELKMTQDEMIIASPPPDNYPSGILAITVHNITGLGLERLNKRHAEVEGEASEEEEESDSLPSAFCTVIVNHRKAFKSRTKPKNSKPFFNAGTERFVPDWRNAEVYVSVRDNRVHENDPLLGIVHLPLHELFAKRSQIDGQFPLAGGVGYGRVRISMVWRSVQLQAPPQALGWSVGTLEIKGTISASEVPKEYQGLRMRFLTNLSKAKMYPNTQDGKSYWHGKKDRSLKLAVHQRYSSCLGIQLRHKGRIKDNVPAFAVLWLKDIPDDIEQELTLPVWKGDYDRATACCLEECGEKVGTITMKCQFFSGLGTAHEHWAMKDRNLTDIYEVLEVAQDHYAQARNEQDALVGVEDHEDASTGNASDSSDDANEDDKYGTDPAHPHHSSRANRGTRPDTTATKEQEDAEDGKGQDEDSKERVRNGHAGPIDRIKDYRHHQRMMHRRNRGVLQWRLPRTAEWMHTKLESAEHHVSDLFKHHTKKQPDIETEV